MRIFALIFQLFLLSLEIIAQTHEVKYVPINLELLNSFTWPTSDFYESVGKHCMSIIDYKRDPKCWLKCYLSFHIYWKHGMAIQQDNSRQQCLDKNVMVEKLVGTVTKFVTGHVNLDGLNLNCRGNRNEGPGIGMVISYNHSHVTNQWPYSGGRPNGSFLQALKSKNVRFAFFEGAASDQNINGVSTFSLETFDEESRTVKILAGFFSLKHYAMKNDARLFQSISGTFSTLARLYGMNIPITPNNLDSIADQLKRKLTENYKNQFTQQLAFVVVVGGPHQNLFEKRTQDRSGPQDGVDNGKMMIRKADSEDVYNFVKNNPKPKEAFYSAILSGFANGPR